jgi:hypothetical protein
MLQHTQYNFVNSLPPGQQSLVCFNLGALETMVIIRLALRGAAQGRLQGLEPPQLHARGGIENKLAYTRDISEETGVQSGGAGDGEVGTSAEAAVVRQERRDKRHPEFLSCTPAGRPNITTRHSILQIQ